MPFSRSVSSLSLCLALGLCSLARAESGSAPLLVQGRGAASVELASGKRVSLPIPAGAEMTATSRVGSGWIAAGTAPSADGKAQELLLLVSSAGNGASISRMPSPPGQTAPVRQEPLPLAAGGRLSGLAWLEGRDRGSFAVRFAPWNGAGWGEPQTVSRAGSGSQLALATARLADGSWLLAWSAFDGTDDEILWSRWDPAVGGNGDTGSRWSPPRRAAQDNAVPDITPALSATADGALLAWSRYDGEGYSTVISRFRGGKWTPPQRVGPKAALYPTFEPTSGSSAWMLLRTAEPGGWSLVEVDAAGRSGRMASVVSTESVRPAVAESSSGTVTFRWPATGAERQTALEHQP